MPAAFAQRIRVPFSPEAPLSGVGRQLKPDELLWYRRSFEAPALAAHQRLLLHFDAVDYACACYVNGHPAGTHAGGYLPFSFDVTDLLVPGEKGELVLCVRDPSDTEPHPRGKQLLQCGTIWYTAQSGIWQDAWWEVVPENRIEELLVDASPDAGDVTINVRVTRPGGGAARGAPLGYGRACRPRLCSGRGAERGRAGSRFDAAPVEPG
jgi:hypothetical protein